LYFFFSYSSLLFFWWRFRGARPATEAHHSVFLERPSLGRLTVVPIKVAETHARFGDLEPPGVMHGCCKVGHPGKLIHPLSVKPVSKAVGCVRVGPRPEAVQLSDYSVNV
jgi:hypothetical protein